MERNYSRWIKPNTEDICRIQWTRGNPASRTLSSKIAASRQSRATPSTNSGLLDCLSPFSSVDDIRRCGTDRGTLCTFYEPEDILDSVREIERDCFEDSTLADSLKNCSRECMTALAELADRYGCCIHSENEIINRR